MYQARDKHHVFWVAESLVLNGCSAQGETEAEAYAQLEESELAWLETADELGWERPENPIRELKVYSGKVALRLSPVVHKEAAQIASDLGISLNQYIGDAIVTYNNRVHGYAQSVSTIKVSTAPVSISYVVMVGSSEPVSVSAIKKEVLTNVRIPC